MYIPLNRIPPRRESKLILDWKPSPRIGNKTSEALQIPSPKIESQQAMKKALRSWKPNLLHYHRRTSHSKIPPSHQRSLSALNTSPRNLRLRQQPWYSPERNGSTSAKSEGGFLIIARIRKAIWDERNISK